MPKASSKKPRGVAPTDPMAARVDPCLATLVDKPPKWQDWAYEVKWDGYRLAVHIEPGRVRILTRGGYDWTDRFPSIADDARRLFDGEAVVLDDEGRSDFGMLQRVLGRLPSAIEAGAIVFYIFDLLYFDGRDLRRLPLRERRRLLEPLIAGREGVVRLSEEVVADGDEFFRVACEHGLEGIIAKHVEKPYRSGRGDWWQKITCKRRDSFVVVGFEPSTTPGHIGRLLLAARKNDELVYVGGCGTCALLVLRAIQDSPNRRQRSSFKRDQWRGQLMRSPERTRQASKPHNTMWLIERVARSDCGSTKCAGYRRERR